MGNYVHLLLRFFLQILKSFELFLEHHVFTISEAQMISLKLYLTALVEDEESKRVQGWYLGVSLSLTLPS